MSEARDEVVARCPACAWESAPVDVDDDQPNGAWIASRDAAGEFRTHFDLVHRPRPHFNIRTKEGSA